MSKGLATKILNTGLVPPPARHITALAATTKRAKATDLIPHPATTVKSAAAPPEGRASSLYLPNGLLLHPCNDKANELENALATCDVRYLINSVRQKILAFLPRYGKLYRSVAHISQSDENEGTERGKRGRGIYRLDKKIGYDLNASALRAFP